MYPTKYYINVKTGELLKVTNSTQEPTGAGQEYYNLISESQYELYLLVFERAYKLAKGSSYDPK